MRICHPFVDFYPTDNKSVILNFYSDASKNPDLGMGAIFENRWIAGQWTKSFMVQEDPSIEFLELFALVSALLVWKSSPLLTNGRVSIFCDNQAVQWMVNMLASSCPQCRKLIRVLALFQITNNVRVFVKYVRSKDNGLADSLSRLDFKRFWSLAPRTMSAVPDELPNTIWPAEKVWYNTFNKLV